MKKTYINPTTEVVKIENTTFLSISNVAGVDGLTKGDDWSSGSAGSKERGTRNTDSFEDLW